jgi:hypothetical protein
MGCTEDNELPSVRMHELLILISLERTETALPNPRSVFRRDKDPYILYTEPAEVRCSLMHTVAYTKLYPRFSFSPPLLS